MKTASRILYIIAIIVGAIDFVSLLTTGILALVNPEMLTEAGLSAGMGYAIAYFIVAFFALLGVINCRNAMRKHNIFNNVLSIVFGVLGGNLLLVLAGIFGCIGCHR